MTSINDAEDEHQTQTGSTFFADKAGEDLDPDSLTPEQEQSRSEIEADLRREISGGLGCW